MWNLIAGPVLSVIDKLIPDPEARAKAAFELTKLQQEGAFKDIEAELEKLRMQADINKIEAASEDKFKSRARPSIIWGCSFCFFYAGFMKPFLEFLALWSGYSGPPFPVIDVTVMFNLLVAVLGIGTMRTVDKKNGVA